MSDPSLFDTINRQRAVRMVKPDPVDDGLIEQIISAATMAPSGGNSQPWRFIVIRDRETKTKLGEIFHALGRELYGENAPPTTPWADVPVLIAICADHSSSRNPLARNGADSSIFPAVQNLLLAAHGLGLGTVLTTRWQLKRDEVSAILGLPENVGPYCIVPLGWPERRHGRPNRKPMQEVTFRERYGTPWS